MAITGSIQEKNGRYHMVINMPTENGKTKPKWETTGLKIRGNKKQAEKILSERLSELNKFNLPYCKISVADYFSDWLQKIQKEVRPNTYRSYYGNMTNHIIPYFEQRKILLQDLKPYHLENYYKSKLQTNSKLSSSSVQVKIIFPYDPLLSVYGDFIGKKFIFVADFLNIKQKFYGNIHLRCKRR